MTSTITTAANAMMITLENVNKWYGQFHVLKDINLQVKPRERIVLCGPSGSGKSTTIRCINHLEEHQQGRIVVDGIHLNDDVRNRAAELHAGPHLGEKDAEEGGGSAGDALP